MNQSSLIAAVLLAGFVLFLAARNRLGVYAAVLWGKTTAPLPNLSGQGGGGSFGGGGSSGSWTDDAQTAAQIAAAFA